MEEVRTEKEKVEGDAEGFKFMLQSNATCSESHQNLPFITTKPGPSFEFCVPHASDRSKVFPDAQEE